LAELAKGRLRAKLPALAEARHGRFTDHHALLIGLSLDHLQHLETTIETLDPRVDELIAWHLLTNNADYTDLGGDYFTRRIDSTPRRRDRLIAELQHMGYRVTLDHVAA